MIATDEKPEWLASADELEQLTPVPPRTPARMRRWAKVFRWKVAEATHEEALPTVMRLWFAALERCDSDGRADFSSGELAEILGCTDRSVRAAITTAKRGGLLQEDSDARHLYLIGAKDEAPSAARLSKRRRVDAIGRRYVSTRERGGSSAL